MSPIVVYIAFGYVITISTLGILMEALRPEYGAMINIGAFCMTLICLTYRKK